MRKNSKLLLDILCISYLLFYSLVIYEGGSVMSQARSLWRLELARTKWAGGFINWLHPMRIRHLTTGRYLGVKENNELYLVDRLIPIFRKVQGSWCDSYRRTITFPKSIITPF